MRNEGKLLALFPGKSKTKFDGKGSGGGIPVCPRRGFPPLCASNLTEPLALVVYEKLLPGSQLVNRLQDIGYRVVAAPECAVVETIAEQEKPMVVFLDLSASEGKALLAIAQLKKNAATNHLPVIGYVDEADEKAQAAAREAGATLVVSDAAVLPHLEEFLQQALHVE